MDPFKLNDRIARKADLILSPADKPIQSYLPKLFPEGKTIGIPAAPVAIEPPFKSTRIAAQRGAFTLFGKIRKSLDKYAKLKPFLRKIIISKTKIVRMIEELRVAGVTETSVFPELSALCKEIVAFWEYEHPEKK